MEGSRRISGAFGWALASNFGLRVANMALGIALARILAPEEIGVYAVALTVWSVLGTVAELGLGSDVIRSKDPERLIPTVTTLSVATGAVLTGGMLLGAPAVADAFGNSGATDVVRVMALGMLVIGFTTIPSALLTRTYRQPTLLAANAAGLVVQATLTIAMALSGMGAMSLAVGFVAGQVVTAIAMAVGARHAPHFGWTGSIARESLAFCIPLASANLVSWLLLSVDNLIVSRELGAVALGLYLYAFNVSSWPMAAIGQAIRVVALPALSQVGDPERRARAFEGAIRVLFPMAVLLGLLLSTLAQPIVRALYGEEWAPAAAALAGLAVFGGLRLLLDLTATYLIACGATRPVLVVQLIWIGFMVPAMILGVRWFDLDGAGWAHVVVAVMIVVPAYLVPLRITGVRIRALAAGGARALPLAVPVAVVAVLVSRTVDNPWAATAIGVAICLGGYGAVMLPGIRRGIQDLRSQAPDGQASHPDPSSDPGTVEKQVVTL